MRPVALAFVALLIALPAPAQDIRPGADINKSIPQTKNKKACFTGAYSNAPIDSEHMVLKRDGTVDHYRYMPHKVVSFTLQVEYEDAEAIPDDKDYPGYDRRYTFALSAKLAERRSLLFAAGECPWRAKDFVSADGNTRVARTGSALHCGIDCDGGGMSLERIADADSLLMRLAANERLRMTGPCGEEDDPLVFNGRDGGREFRLNPASASVCAPIARWRKSDR